MSDEAPIVWRMTWDYYALRLSGKPGARKLSPNYADFVSKEDANAAKIRLKAEHGDYVVVEVTPIYISHAKQQREMARRQHSAADVWPQQVRS